MNVFTFFIIIVVIMNLITFLAFGWDKRKAVKDKWRTPEATLITLMLLGGAVGGTIGMNHWHHKTQKLKFKVARIASYFTLAAILYIGFWLGHLGN